MSDKTLVERLRDMADESDKRSSGNSITEYVYPVKTKEAEAILGRPCIGRQDECELFMAIADAIEREYLPRPRFDDGKPVQFGDIAEVREDLGDVIEMVYQGGKCVEVVIGFGDEETASHYMVCEGERIKRPEPEVLDVDGVPILVGDTVYATRYGYVECTVLSIEWVCDGWLVEVENCGGHKFRQTSDEFTHKQPDSLERIEADAEKSVCVYFDKQGSPKCNGCDKSLSPYLECHREMMLDLLNRQREVLERNHER